MEEYVKSEIREFLLHRINKCRILVLGDVMLDRYFYGNVKRISPEAPVPVNNIIKKSDRLGGAANVAHNLAKLGSQVYLAGIIGNDHHSRILKHSMKKLMIPDNGLILGREKTTTKIRILGGHQQMMRLDFEETSSISDDVRKRIERYVQNSVESGVNAVILSDYHKGVCNESICRFAISVAHKAGIPVFIDPKGKSWQCYAGADYITPNVREISEVLGYEVENEEKSLRRAAEQIKREYDIANVMITRSEKGISFFAEEGELHIPTVAQEVFDVSGAGDTVIAAFSTGVAGGMEAYVAIQMANYAAGIGVGKVGTYAVRKSEMLLHLL